ncbi:MAG TPA: glyoxalase [Chloroflexi bacterium]|nr:glyoxalase [Chloroflexota bacterium]HBY08314.1 glyoxalase [Chloroflexota bacterium]
MTEFGLAQIGQIAVNVENLDVAVAFYRDTLGMKFLFQFPRLAFFDCAGVRLLLDQVDEWQHPSSILYYKVADIQATHQVLLERGVIFTDAPHLVAKMPDHDLWMAFFNDPAGNILALMSEIRDA